MENITYVSIADTDAAAPTAAGIASPTTVAAGAVALVNEGNVILNAAAYTALASDARVRIVQNIGGRLVSSCAMTKGKLRLGMPASGTPAPGTVSQYSAAVQQVTVIGYNGTSGSLPSANSTSYYIKIRKNDNDAGNRSQPFSLFSQFKTDASATQEELAFGLVKVGTKNMENEPANKYLKFEALCDDAGAADATATTIDIDYGSKTGTLNAGATTFVVGDLLRIGGGATTDPVYKITALAGTTVTLDIAYQSASGTGIAIEYITAALAAAAEFGVRLTGIESDFDVNAMRDWYSNRFTATFSDDSTLVTHVQGASDGVGVWQKVAMDEYMSMGFQGQNEMLGVPPTMRTSSVVTAGEYDALMLTADEEVHGLTSANTETSSVILYLQDGSGSPSGLAVAVALGWAAGDFT